MLRPEPHPDDPRGQPPQSRETVRTFAIAKGGFGVAVLRSTLLMTRFWIAICMRWVMRVGHSRRLLHGAQIV